MAQPAIQTSFASGEWAPKLRSRVDVQKYKAGAALLRNFYVDWSGGGASTRQGTLQLNRTLSNGARLIEFQPSANLSYVLEFGQNYIRFYSNSAPILESPVAITGIPSGSNLINLASQPYNPGDWLYVTGASGVSNINQQFWKVATTGVLQISVVDVFNNPPSPLFTGYISGGTVQRVYTISSPYNTSDLFPNPITGNPGIKFVQDVTSLIITHPSYPTQVLTINAPTNWTINPANFGTTIGTPTGLALVSNLGAGTFAYGYTVTAVDANGQESIAATPVTVASLLNIQTNSGTNSLSWAAVTGAQSYNVYKADSTVTVPIATGAQYGFVANVTGTTFTDTTPGIAPDFSQTFPVGVNPFFGAPITSYTVTTPGTYTTVPGVTIGAPPAGGIQATSSASLGVTVAALNQHHTGGIGDVITNSAVSPLGFNMVFSNGVQLQITSAVLVTPGPAFWGWNVNSVAIFNPGSITSIGSSTPTNPIAPTSCTAPNTVPGGPFGVGFNYNFTWGVTQLFVIQPGAYLTPPSVTFSAGAAAATAVLGPTNAGNPGVPAFIQERLTLAAQPSNVQGFNMSQPDSFFNFNVSFPSQDDDAISGSIISEQLNDIRSMIPVPTGLIAFTGKSAWLLNGGGGISTLNPITPSNITASPQAFNGASNVWPVKVNMDILYCTHRGSYVRDLTYNIYANIFTGTDITTFSNHLFSGYYIVDWTWAEEPFKTLWAVRSDGALLSLGYVKEQELIGWAHHDTNGRFKSVTSVIETDAYGNSVDAVYVVVERVLNNTVVQVVERMANRIFLYGYEDSWSVDCAVQTLPQTTQSGILTINGDVSTIGNSVTVSDFTGATPFTSTMATNNWVIRASGGIYKITGFTSTIQVTATVVRPPPDFNSYDNSFYDPSIPGYTIWVPVSFVTGLSLLAGKVVTGVADGVVVTPRLVNSSGGVTLDGPATKVTLGLSFLPQLQTLPLELGEPTVQSKRKKVPAATMRVADTLGLQVGTSFANAVTVKDFQIGAIPSQSNGPALVSDLFNGDGRQILDQVWQEIGQLCVQQNLPYPATVLGIMPEVVVGDTPNAGQGR